MHTSEATTESVVRVLDAPVRRVTLLEDRAQVRRAGALVLEPGDWRVVVEGASPVLADRTLLCRASGASVLEARVVRRLRIGRREATPDQAVLLAERERLQAAGLPVRNRLAALERHRQRLGAALDLLLDGINRELPWAERREERWERDLERVLEQQREVLAELRLRQAELADLTSQAGTAALQELTTRDGPPLLTRLEVELRVARAGTVELELDYMVPCAMWRPIHRAALQGGAVRFACEGAVWQATGEDWEEVELAFSTARPTRRSEPPLLTDDELRLQRRQDKGVQVQVREEAIHTVGEGQGEARRASELPGVDDGGETRTLGAPARATIRATGRLHRVPIFAWEAPAEVDRIARPERSPLVHLRSRQVNPGPHPILAGPLELLRESGYVGLGEVGFVGPGERFVLGWGADDGLRVRREVEEEREVARLTGKQTITRKVTLQLSNLEPLPASFGLEERVLVSEVEQVKVALDPAGTKPPAQADAQGIVAWKVTVPPRGTREVELLYRITASSSVQGL
jgi:uncharacterized protein (TIGR02231 family)